MQSRAVERDAAKLGLVVPQEQQHREAIPLLNGGFRTDKSPDDLAPNEMTTLSGLHIVAGRLVVDTGYIPFGGVYRGIAQGTFEVFFNDGTSVVLLFTTTNLYQWSLEALQWQVVALNGLHETTAAYSAGATSFALDSMADIAVNVLVGIQLDNGSQLITRVNAVSVLTITTDDAVPVGRTVANGAVVVPALSLHGNPAVSQSSAVVFPSNDWIIFSNGIDPVMYYYHQVAKALGGLPTATTCKTIAVYHELVLLGNTTENGTHFPHRVRQSDAADPEEWTTGIAAIYDLLDTDDEILKLLPLGPWLIAYRQASVMRASYVGVLNQILFWEYMTQLEGAQSQGAVCDVGGEHVFVGVNGVYAYQGGYDLEEIGEQVFVSFLSPSGDFNAAARETLFIIHVADLDEVWIFYPKTGSAFPNTMLRVQLENQAWARREFADSFYAAGPLLPQETITWAGAMGVWSDSFWARPWDSRVFIKNVPSILMCPVEAGGVDTQLALYEYAAITDAGATISWELTTRQYGDGASYTRWESLSFVAVGEDVLVEASQDEGVTFYTVATLDFDETPSVRQTYIDRVSTRLQLRLSGVDHDFQLRRGVLTSEMESEW